MNNLRFGYGPMMPKLEEQANEQGYTLGNKGEQLESIKFAINMVGFHVATETQVNQMFAKLNKKVLAALKEIKGE